MSSQQSIQTVLGPVAPEAIGYTLPHEHLYIQLWDVPGRFDGKDQLEDDDVLAEELAVFQAQGGNCLVELTTPGLGRKPERLRTIAERTGLHIVMGCGWYREPYYPAADELDRRSVASLADQIVREIVEGVGDTGIRPGVIGEIGADHSWVSPIEERVHRAAGRAQVATGLPLVTHGVKSDVGLAQLEILDDEGADLSRVAVAHCDSFPHADFVLEVARRGAYVAFDNVGAIRGERHEARIAELIRRLLDAGHQDQILLSHDICNQSQLRYNDGFGFGYLVDSFLPKLWEAGIPRDVTRAITEENSKRWLAVTA
jgi:predicted metal-dependent phosphotriesterase family hydrolase